MNLNKRFPDIINSFLKDDKIDSMTEYVRKDRLADVASTMDVSILSDRKIEFLETTFQSADALQDIFHGNRIGKPEVVFSESTECASRCDSDTIIQELLRKSQGRYIKIRL